MSAEDLHRAYPQGRLTSQRSVIAHAASAMSGAFSASDLAKCVGDQDPAIGLATVYRAVAALEASGWIVRAGERDGAALYVRCEHEGHHHHLVCTSCGSVEHAPCPLGDDLTVAAGAAGFRITGHEVTLWGLCRSCDASGIERGEPKP